MLTSALAARRRNRDDDGFTLIELMVVVLIIAILIAIAIPTFLGARNRAQDRAAQSSLRNALTAAKTIYTDGEDYTQVFDAAGQPTPLAAVEPSLQFVVTASTGQTMVFVDKTNTTDHYIDMATYSKSGTCMWISDETQGNTAGTKFAKVQGACGTTPPAAWNGW